jgi:hypothetical protein
MNQAVSRCNLQLQGPDCAPEGAGIAPLSARVIKIVSYFRPDAGAFDPDTLSSTGYGRRVGDVHQFQGGVQ